MPKDGTQLEQSAKTDLDLGSVAYFCANCGNKITHSDQAFAMNGDFERVVFNPMGRIFRIATFRHAPGVALVGDRSTEFSWFKGYDWTIAICGQCRTHLGWYFSGPGEPPDFHGLIRPHLTIRAES